MPVELPTHYRTAIRRLVRFAAVFWVVGMLMGIVSTEYQKQMRYGPTASAPQVFDPPQGRTRMQLPPGMMWETGFDLRISHGHFILIGGVIPICVAVVLVLLQIAGGSEVSPGVLKAFYWLYLSGGAAALLLISYKGIYTVLAVRGGMFDLGQVHQEMFLGSKALRALSHAFSHTVLAAGLALISWAFWRSAGAIKLSPSAPAPAA